MFLFINSCKSVLAKGQFQNNYDMFSELRVRLKCITRQFFKNDNYELQTNFDVNLSKMLIAFQQTLARCTWYVNQFKFYFWHIWKFINTWQVSRTFPAFKSRCIMPCLCKCTNPWHIPRQTCNEFITCFHESWIYKTWILSMKFASCFDLCLMDLFFKMPI